jgi:hypothetical protein
MTIDINEQWRIKSTPDCWEVQQRHGIRSTGPREGQVDWDSRAYRANLESAMKTLYEYRVRDIKAVGLEAAVKEIQALQDEVHSLCRRLDLCL